MKGDINMPVNFKVIGEDNEEEQAPICTFCNNEEVEDEGAMCDDCQNEHYTCEHCDGLVHQDDTTTVQSSNSLYSWRWSEVTVCESCRDRHYTCCDACNAYYPDHRMSSINGNDICPTCVESDYYSCNGCNDMYHRDNISHCDDDDEYYCSDCMPESKRISSQIKNYSHKPTTRFFELPDKLEEWEYAPQTNKEFYGIEVEVDHGSDLSDDLINPLSEYLPHAYYKEDGSLDENGFEIVTHPCTYEYHMASNYAEAFKLLRANDFRSHDTETCGMHVHISRTAFGADANEQMYHLSRFMYLVEKFYDQIFKLSRRTNASMNRWAKRYGIEQQPEQMYRKNNGRDGVSSGRYYILNFENVHTVEMRAFRGTLTLATFQATLQLVKGLKDLALSKRDLTKTEWKDFCKFVKAKGFNELTQYIFDKGLRPSEAKLSEEVMEIEEMMDRPTIPTMMDQDYIHYGNDVDTRSALQISRQADVYLENFIRDFTTPPIVTPQEQVEIDDADYSAIRPNDDDILRLIRRFELERME